MRNTSVVGRTAAIAAVVVAGVAVAVMLLGSGSDYRVKAHFQNASQLVKGNLVQVSGTPVGEVERTDLTDDGQAEVTLKISEDYAPLRKGTEATIRQSSLSGIANRYIDLRLPPATASEIADGGVLEQSDTTTAVDLDQLFNVFGPREREALQEVILGFGTFYAGEEKNANAGLVYLNPSLAASSRLFRELTYDQKSTRRFVVESSRLVTDLAERREDLAGLVTNLNQTTGALNRQRTALADSIRQLPDFMRRADTTFVNLRATLDDLEPLVDESKPVARKLRPFLAELRPLARDAVPTVRDLSRLIRRVGPSNDLIDLTRTNVPVRDIAIGPVQANGKQREGAFPATARALGESTGELAFARPYAVDLTAWFDDFSHSGYYDALGSVGRVALNVNAFSIVGGLPTNLIPAGARGGAFDQLASQGAVQLNQNNRCPGSLERTAPDGSNPFVPPGGNCDPSQVPLGP